MKLERLYWRNGEIQQGKIRESNSSVVYKKDYTYRAQAY